MFNPREVSFSNGLKSQQAKTIELPLPIVCAAPAGCLIGFGWTELDGSKMAPRSWVQLTGERAHNALNSAACCD